MEELVEQYNNVKKWRKEMFIAMIVLLALMVLSVVLGIIFRELLVLFVIFGIIMSALGVTVNILSANTLKKAGKIIKDFLSANGKTEEEIIAILGNASK